MKKNESKNHLGTPTPRCFPDWMRRLNPFFKREDINPMVELQQRCKFVYHTDIICKKSNKIIHLSFIFLFFTFFLMKCNVCLMVPIFIIYLIFILSRKSLSLPLFMISILKEKTGNKFTRDLWLAGITGSEIIETILLNRAKSLFINLMFIQVFLCSLELYHLMRLNDILTTSSFAIISFHYCITEVMLTIIAHCINIDSFQTKPLNILFKKKVSWQKERAYNVEGLREIVMLLAFLLLIIFSFSKTFPSLFEGTTQVFTWIGLSGIFLVFGILLRKFRRKDWIIHTHTFLKQKKYQIKSLQNFLKKTSFRRESCETGKTIDSRPRHPHPSLLPQLDAAVESVLAARG